MNIYEAEKLFFLNSAFFVAKGLSVNVRVIALYLAIKTSKKELKIYRDTNLFDLTSIFFEQINDLWQNGVKVKSLFNIKSKLTSDLLKNKIHDLALIFKLYNLILHKNGHSTQGYYKKALRLIGSDSIFKQCVLSVSNLDVFTTKELFEIKCIIQQSKKICILNNICLEENTQNLSLSKLLEFAKRNNIITTFKNISNKNKLVLHKANTIFDEINFICRTITYYTLNHKYKLDDFYIFVKNAPEYSFYIEQYLSKYKIKYSLTKQQKLALFTIVRFILLLFEIILTNFNTEKIWSYLKIGLTNLTEKEIFLIEIYTKTYEISFSDWVKGFSKCKDKVIKNEYLVNINNIRKKIINPILNFKEDITKKVNAKEIINAVCIFISKNKIKNNLENLIKTLLKNNKKELANCQIDSWNLTKKIFEDIDLLLKNQKINLIEFYSLFKLLVEKTYINYSESYLNSVKIITSKDDLLQKKCKIAFVIGATDDYFSDVSDNFSGIFNNNEIKILENLGLYVVKDVNIKNEEERLEVQKFLEISSEKTYVTYPKFSLNADSMKPAWFTKFAKESRDENFEDSILNLDDIFKLYSPKYVFDNLLLKLNNRLINKKYLLFLERYNKPAHHTLKNNKNIVKSLNNVNNSASNLTISPTQIETYYNCPFKFLCKYLLNLKLVKLEKIDAIKYGEFVHLVLEKIFKNYTAKEILTFKQEDLKGKILEILNDYLNKCLNYIDTSSIKFKNMFSKAVNVLISSLNHISTGLENGNFYAKFFELKIGEDIPPLKADLENLGTVNIIGKIDRLDIFKTTEKSKEINYIRIIDYKTRGKDFNILDVLYGLNLQMLVYMLTILKNQHALNLKNTKFAGIFYTPVQNSTVLANNKNVDLSKINVQRLKKLRTNGLILEDLNIINAMEPNANGVYIPITIKDGKIKANENTLVNIWQVDLILKYTIYLVKNMVQKIYCGEFLPSPLKSKIYDPCEYCDYKKICLTRKSSIKEIFIEQKEIDEIYNEMNIKVNSKD